MTDCIILCKDIFFCDKNLNLPKCYHCLLLVYERLEEYIEIRSITGTSFEQTYNE